MSDDIKTIVQNNMTAKQMAGFLRQYKNYRYNLDRKERAKRGQLNPTEVKTKSELGGYVRGRMSDDNTQKATNRAGLQAVESYMKKSLMESLTGKPSDRKPVKTRTMSGALGFGAMLRYVPGAGSFLSAMKPKEAGRGSARFGPGSKKD